MIPFLICVTLFTNGIAIAPSQDGIDNEYPHHLNAIPALFCVGLAVHDYEMLPRIPDTVTKLQHSVITEGMNGHIWIPQAWLPNLAWHIQFEVNDVSIEEFQRAESYEDLSRRSGRGYIGHLVWIENLPVLFKHGIKNGLIVDSKLRVEKKPLYYFAEKVTKGQDYFVVLDENLLGFSLDDKFLMRMVKSYLNLEPSFIDDFTDKDLLTAIDETTVTATVRTAPFYLAIMDRNAKKKDASGEVFSIHTYEFRKDGLFQIVKQKYATDADATRAYSKARTSFISQAKLPTEEIQKANENSRALTLPRMSMECKGSWVNTAYLYDDEMIKANKQFNDASRAYVEAKNAASNKALKEHAEKHKK